MRLLKYCSLLLLPLLMLNCSPSKEARGMKTLINGNWTLKTITIEGNNSIINLTVFNEADNHCFIGSSWTFVSNNSSGRYMIPPGAGGCNSLTRKIKWSIYEPKGEEKKFQFKRLDDKNNPLDDNDGYRLSIVKLDATQMQLKSVINYEGNPVDVVYNFEKH